MESEKPHPSETGKRRGTSERREMVAEVVRQIDSGILQMQSQPKFLFPPVSVENLVINGILARILECLSGRKKLAIN